MKRKKWDSEKATVVCTPFPQLSLLLLIIVVIINIIVSFFFPVLFKHENCGSL